MINKPKNKKLTFLLIVISVLIIIIGITPERRDVYSAASDNVSGWAWSETIGWISFNCTDRGVCGTSNYGVKINADGTFSGYAWSENIGWIDFAPSGPYPAAPNYSAKFDFETGEINGWARALAYGDGWDGWILLGKETGGWANQIRLNTGNKEFYGWAWGSDVVGWVSFNCADRGVCGTSNYKVITGINFSPSVSCNDTETWNYCSDSRNPTISWNYSDPENNPQESYWVQIDNNSDFSSPEINTGEVFSSSNSYHPSGATLDWGATYYWRVRAKDTFDNWSDWSTPNCSFTTLDHAYPNVNFSWTPENPSVDEPVQFIDESTCYDDNINGGPCTKPNDSYDWNFENAVPSSSILENPVATFSDPGKWQVDLTVTDSDGYSCPIFKSVDVNFPLPDWREVIPKE